MAHALQMPLSQLSKLLPGLAAGLAPGAKQGLHILRQQGLSTASGSANKAGSMWTNYKQLSKARLSALVALTATAGYAVGSGDTIDWFGMLATSVGTFGAAACANTLNQLFEIKNDALMQRTRNRPLPTGRMGRLHALAFAVVCGASGLGILATQTNTLTTSLGAANILLYAGIYTPLKQLSIANTWVGAIVGAIPPLMGWSAASGSLSPGAWVLAGCLYFWQMPHFLSLAWLCKDDYLRGGYRMLSSIDATGRRVASCSLRNSLYLLPIGALAALLDTTSPWFAYESAALAAGMALASAAFWLSPSKDAARKLFRLSLLYLPVTMAAMVAHRRPDARDVTYEEAYKRVEGWVDRTLPQLLHSGLVATHGLLRPVSQLIETGGDTADGRCPSKAYGEAREGQEGGAGGVGEDGVPPEKQQE